MLDTKEEIERRMDELAREYGRTPPGDPRRAEIAKQLSALCLRLDLELTHGFFSFCLLLCYGRIARKNTGVS